MVEFHSLVAEYRFVQLKDKMFLGQLYHLHHCGLWVHSSQYHKSVTHPTDNNNQYTVIMSNSVNNYVYTFVIGSKRVALQDRPLMNSCKGDMFLSVDIP